MPQFSVWSHLLRWIDSEISHLTGCFYVLCSMVFLYSGIPVFMTALCPHSYQRVTWFKTYLIMESSLGTIASRENMKSIWTLSISLDAKFLKEVTFSLLSSPFRFMVGCGRCDDWFHGDCVGLSLSQAQQMGEEDKEYVCIRCCAEEDKKTDILDTETLETQASLEAHSEDKRVECGKLTSSSSKHEDKHRHMDDPGRHKVKIVKRVSFQELCMELNEIQRVLLQCMFLHFSIRVSWIRRGGILFKSGDLCMCMFLCAVAV